MSSIPIEGPIISELVAEDASFADLVEEFLDGLDDRLNAMRVAIDNDDFDSLRTLAHQLKGAGGGHGYPIISEKASLLEQQAVSQQMINCKRVLDDLHSIRPRITVMPS